MLLQCTTVTGVKACVVKAYTFAFIAKGMLGVKKTCMLCVVQVSS